MKFSIGLLLLVLGFSTTMAQTIKFQKLFGGQGDEYLKGALQTPDSGYILAGVTNTFGAGSEDFYLVKLDKNGEILWTKTYGGPGGDFDPKFIATKDSGYAFIGTTYSFGAGPKAYVVKVDKQGYVNWSKTFSGVDLVYGTAIEQSLDGGFLIGTSNTINSISSASIIKTDSLGNVLWTKTSSNSEWVKSIKETKDLGFIVIGESVHGVNPIPDIYILKWNASGNLSWKKKIEFSFGHKINEAKDGGYILGISGGLVKLDSLGNVIWLRGYHMGIQTVNETDKGGYIVTGRTKDFGADDAIVLETDSVGAVIWSRTYGVWGASEEGYVAFQTADGGYCMAGIQFTTFGPSAFYIVKTDSAKDAGCFQMNVNALDTLYPEVSTAFSTSVGTAPDNSQFVTTTVGTGGSMQIICSSVGIQEVKPPVPFHLYPNPASDILFIETPFNKGEQVKLTNVLGATFEVSIRRTGNKIELALQNLPQGLYMVKYTTGEISQSAKFFKK